MNLSLIESITKLPRPLVYLTVFAVVIAGCLFSVRQNSISQLDTYNSLRLGMSEEEVYGILGRADYTCEFHNKRVSYFFSRGLTGLVWTIKTNFGGYPSIVAERCQIPDLYDSVQVLINVDGKVEAITWNGEELTIRTDRGAFSGSNVSQLPESFFE